MKNRIKLAIAIEHKANKNETVTPMETVCFTNIVAQELSAMPINKWADLLNLISVEYNLKCTFTPNGFFGNCRDIQIAQKILINSVKNN